MAPLVSSGRAMLSAILVRAAWEHAESGIVIKSREMIVQERGDQLILIRQTDHALLSGFFAREWGNELFRKPPAFDSFCLAAGEHDNGWREWELEPEVDPRSRQPYTFMSIPTQDHIALYQRGIERVVRADHYAGLLVSLHCSNLYDRTRATMPGYSAKYVKSSETEIANEFVQRLKLQQLRLKVDLRANAATKDFTEDKTLQAALARLDALDRLSLFFCMGPSENATIEAVPADNKGGEADLELRIDGNTLCIKPYPFRRSPLNISILAREIPKRMYVDDVDFQTALARAQYFALNYTIRANDSSALRSAVA